MCMEVPVGAVAACNIMKWTTGVGVIGTRWADPGETHEISKFWSGGTPKQKKIEEYSECDT
jgi:hypothetical protein